jgi:hypothetical protein
MSHALTPDLFFGNLNTTAVANDPLVTYSLVFAAMALIVFDRSENPLTEKAVAFGLVSPVIDRFGFQYLTTGTLKDFLG